MTDKKENPADAELDAFVSTAAERFGCLNVGGWLVVPPEREDAFRAALAEKPKLRRKVHWWTLDGFLLDWTATVEDLEDGTRRYFLTAVGAEDEEVLDAALEAAADGLKTRSEFVRAYLTVNEINDAGWWGKAALFAAYARDEKRPRFYVLSVDRRIVLAGPYADFRAAARDWAANDRFLLKTALADGLRWHASCTACAEWNGDACTAGVKGAPFDPAGRCAHFSPRPESLKRHIHL